MIDSAIIRIKKKASALELANLMNQARSSRRFGQTSATAKLRSNIRVPDSRNLVAAIPHLRLCRPLPARPIKA
jgi:hypothetical protein